MKPRASTLLVWLGVLFVAAACGPSDERAGAGVIDGMAFGTFYRVSLPGLDDPAVLERVQRDLDERLDDIDATMSTYRDDSELNRLNSAPFGEWLVVSEALFEVLSTALEVGEETDGAFDITIGGLVNLWGFGPEGRPERIPEPERLQQRLEASGSDTLELDASRRTARRLADVFVDVSGIAKGYAVDAIAALLDDHGFEHYLASIGGDLVARGRPEPGRRWRIGIEDPATSVARPIRTLELENVTVATSGDYRNFFEHDGRRYSHIIDPRTGHPLDHRLASVTVLHRDNIRADAYATGLLVLGPEQGLATAERLGLKALFLVGTDEGFEHRQSPALAATDTVLPAGGSSEGRQ